MDSFSDYGSSSSSFPTTKKRERKLIGDYIVGKTLGEGSFGKVKLGTHYLTKKRVALKLVDYKTATPKDLVNLEREKKIAGLLDHPNIVRLYDVIDMPEKKICCLVLEYITGGELFDYIVAKSKLREQEACQFFRQMLSALEYCHHSMVIHRDLKPENLLMDANRNIKINDFGLSNFMKPGTWLQTHCGSPMYSSPEIIQQVHYMGPEVDVWALGVIVYAMVCGYLPWEGKSLKEQVGNAARGNYRLPNHVSPECADLIARMLKVDPKQRATLAELREHVWVNKWHKTPPPSCIPENKPITNPDPEILQKMEELGFNKKEVVEDLYSNRKTTQGWVMYFLMYHHQQKKQAEEQGTTTADDTSSFAHSDDDDDDYSSESEEDERFEAALSEMDESRARQSFEVQKRVEQEKKKKQEEEEAAKKVAQEEETKRKRAGTMVITKLDAKLEGQEEAKRVVSDDRGIFDAALPVVPPISPSPQHHSPNRRASWLTRLRKSARDLLRDQDAHSSHQSANGASATTSPVPASPQPKSNAPVIKSIDTDGIVPKERLSLNTEVQHPHKEPSAEDKLRIVKGAFSVETTTTKMLTPLQAEIELTFAKMKVDYKVSTKKGVTYKCKTQMDSTDVKTHKHKIETIKFELEICKIDKLDIKGIKFKRQGGSVWSYKELVDRIVKSLNL